MDDDIDIRKEGDTPPMTAPDSFSVTVDCFESEEDATSYANLIGQYVREVSRYIDLARLDGVTIANDYVKSLSNIDRGYESNHTLTPTEDHAIGVAMTPAVLRDGKVKSHIIIDANIAMPLNDANDEYFDLALHTFVHECAHVEVTAKFDASFPGLLLQRKFGNMHDGIRWQIISACWDEYAVTSICANYGKDPTDGYEEVFINVLLNARDSANECIKEYRRHGDVDKVYQEVYRIYGQLLKFASYHIGNLAGKNISVNDRIKTVNALDGHWFYKYFFELKGYLDELARNYGKWNSCYDF